MEKTDFRKLFKPLYNPPLREFVEIDVPEMQFVKVDGEGNPNTSPAYGSAVEWLYSTSYAMKFASRAATGRDYVVPPLEGLWWADDPASFVSRRKDRWKWTMMIMVPDFVGRGFFAAAVDRAAGRLGAAPASLRLERLVEGRCLQTLHVGSYDDEAPLLERLHHEIMPARHLVFNGRHHEIYLSDPRRVEPEKLRTVLRQPVKAG